jgi:MinD-like ATPase involved in chromosome partitioning or flagellar assembly
LASKGKQVLLAKTGSDFTGIAGCPGYSGGMPGPSGTCTCRKSQEGEEPAATPYKRLYCLAPSINCTFFQRQDLMEAFISRTEDKLKMDFIIIDLASAFVSGLAEIGGRFIHSVLLVTPEPGAMEGGFLKARKMASKVPLSIVMNRWNRSSDGKKAQVFIRLMEKYLSPPADFLGGISFYPEIFQRVPSLGPAALLKNETLNREFSELAANFSAIAGIEWQ